jgi:hypothetical protein
MNFLYRKNLSQYRHLLIIIVLLQLFSCKKEVVEVNVDAYSNLAPDVKFEQGVYTLKFTLQDYPYQEVGVRLSSDKGLFAKEEATNKQIAVEISADRYAVFYDSLVNNNTYFYQIYVKDPVTSRLVYSDVLFFNTNP